MHRPINNTDSTMSIHVNYFSLDFDRAVRAQSVQGWATG